MKQAERATQQANLWARLDELRDQGVSHRPLESVVAPLATMLLLRWAEHVDAEQEAVASFDGRDYAPALSREKHWSSWSELRGEQLVHFLRDEVLPGLRHAPCGMLGQSLQRLIPVVEALAKAGHETIEALVRWSHDFDLETIRGRQEAGDALAALVEQAGTSAAKVAGEFTTPRPVVELLVDLVAPHPGERIYDPCFGTGGLLAAVSSSLREEAHQMPPKVWTDVQQRSVFGVEINPTAYTVGLARVVLSGIEQPGLELGDALERPLARDRSADGFDCILAVPPWGRVFRPDSHETQTTSPYIETRFLQHVMGSLRRGGRAAIVLPDVALFRPGPERLIRKELLHEYHVDGVISLPPKTLHPFTSAKCSVLVFRRDTPAKSVRFVVARELIRSATSWLDQLGARTVGLPESDPNFNWELAQAVRPPACGADMLIELRGEADRWCKDRSWSWEVPVATLARRDWELVAKKTGEDALARSLKAVEEADANVRVQPLSQVAEVFAGITYGKEVTTPRRDDPSVVVGLVRVADVNRVGVRAPSLFLTEHGAARVKPKHRLRPGDVLVTTSGTIGRPGVVAEGSGAVDAVAAKSLVVVRPSEHLAPRFLKSLLDSETYQDWLRGHARGATIQHLSVRTLRHLPVPIPELPIQERIVRETPQKDGNALATLVRVVTAGGEDPVVTWLDGSPEVLELRRFRQQAEPVVVLERIAHSVRSLRDGVVHFRANTLPDLARWLMQLSEAVSTLQGLGHVPPGSGRLAILDSAQLRLEHVQSALGESPLPVLDSAREVTKGISRLVRAELESILEDVRLEPGVEPSAVVAGMANEVQVRLKNLSSLALRNASASTSPDVGSARVAYLAESQALSFSAQIPARAETGPFRFRLRWRAERLDGRPVSGEAPLAVDVRSTREAVRLAELGTSPYIVGSPIDREEMFFGRLDIIDRIQRQLSTSHRANVILLEGNRRTGKTSILKRLQAPDVLPGWVAVNCSFQGGEGHENKAGLPTNEVFRLMARGIGWAAHDAGVRVWFPDVDPPDPNKPFKVEFVKGLSAAFSGPRPFQVFELYLHAVLEAASPHRLLLMLDEFDKLQEGIDAGITSPQVPENIRYLLHTYPGLSAVLTGARRLKRLREEYWSALFGFGHRIPVSELPLADARLLVTRPVEGRLTYIPEATDRVVELCARQPFLIQSLCNRIFEGAALSNKQTVTVGVVDTAAEDMVRDNEHFRTLWGYAGTERRRFVLALCQQLEGEPDPITLSLLEAKLEEHGVALPRGDRLGADLEILRELELLELFSTTRGSAYTLAVPLMADWIRRNIDFEDQRQKAVRESEDIEDGGGSGYGGYGGGRPDGSGYGYGEYGGGLPDGSGYGDGRGSGSKSPMPEDEQ